MKKARQYKHRRRCRPLPLGLPESVIYDLTGLARYACSHQTCWERYLWYKDRRVGRVSVNVLGRRAIVHWLLRHPHGVEIRRFHIEFDMGFGSHVTIRRFRAYTLAQVKNMNRTTKLGLYLAKYKQLNDKLTK